MSNLLFIRMVKIKILDNQIYKLLGLNLTLLKRICNLERHTLVWLENHSSKIFWFCPWKILGCTTCEFKANLRPSLNIPKIGRKVKHARSCWKNLQGNITGGIWNKDVENWVLVLVYNEVQNPMKSVMSCKKYKKLKIWKSYCVWGSSKYVLKSIVNSMDSIRIGIQW